MVNVAPQHNRKTAAPCLAADELMAGFPGCRDGFRPGNWDNFITFVNIL